MRTLLLVRHAPTAATRGFAFPADEPLDERGRDAASAVGAAVPRRFGVMCSPSARCLQTAEAAGLAVEAVEPALAECDFGTWAGRTLEDVIAAEPEAGQAWMTDPDAAPHGGESLRSFAARVAGWLERQAELDGGAVAITHGGVVKAAVIAALSAPIDAFWRVDAAPLAITELHAHDGRWTLTRANVALASGVAARGSGAARGAAATGAAAPATLASGDAA
jgi:broad specificity phosphatase PhoE